MALSIKEQCRKRLVGLKSTRQPYEADWREIARYAQPARSRFLATSETNRNKRREGRVYDSHGIQAFRTLTGGMTSGLSSSSRPWFKLALYDQELMDDPEVTAWLDDCEKRMYGFIAGTNFYGAVKTGYSEMGLFGSEGCVMLEDDDEGAVCHALTAGEYWIALSKAMVPDTLYRTVPMTVMQAVTSFGGKVSTRVRSAYDQSNYEQMVDVFHAIEPNFGREPGRMDAKGKPFRSIWWDEADGGGETLLREHGYWEQPFWAPRWDTTGSDAWGDSPGMVALPELRELQLYAKRKGQLVDFLANPERISPPNVKLTGMAGNIVSSASVDAAQVIVPYQINPMALAQVREDIGQTKQAIDAASYAELFMAITNMQGIQPRTVEEIASRNEEKLTQLGPVIERVNNEKLEVALNRTFGIMVRGGLLAPAPEALQDVDLKFEFVSILTQMQRMVGLGQIERTAGFVGNLAAVNPDVIDKLNFDEMIDEYADRAGAPAKMIRTADQVAEIRNQRAQAVQAEKAAAMMPAVQQGADAARLLSETDAGGGQNLLQTLLPA